MKGFNKELEELLLKKQKKISKILENKEEFKLNRLSALVVTLEDITRDIFFATSGINSFLPFKDEIEKQFKYASEALRFMRTSSAMQEWEFLITELIARYTALNKIIEDFLKNLE